MSHESDAVKRPRFRVGMLRQSHRALGITQEVFDRAIEFLVMYDRSNVTMARCIMIDNLCDRIESNESVVLLDDDIDISADDLDRLAVSASDYGLVGSPYLQRGSTDVLLGDLGYGNRVAIGMGAIAISGELLLSERDKMRQAGYSDPLPWCQTAARRGRDGSVKMMPEDVDFCDRFGGAHVLRLDSVRHCGRGLNDEQWAVIQSVLEEYEHEKSKRIGDEKIGDAEQKEGIWKIKQATAVTQESRIAECDQQERAGAERRCPYDPGILADRTRMPGV